MCTDWIGGINTNIQRTLNNGKFYGITIKKVQKMLINL